MTLFLQIEKYEINIDDKHSQNTNSFTLVVAMKPFICLSMTTDL